MHLTKDQGSFSSFVFGGEMHIFYSELILHREAWHEHEMITAAVVWLASGVLFSAGSKELASPTNSLQITGLQSGMTYTWKVKALNAYGWGEYGAEYHFSVP